MPKIIEYFGLVFYFYANEHEPIHVHVSSNEFESVFEIFFEDGVLTDIQTRNVRGIEPLPPKQLKDAQKVVEEYALTIVEKWMDFFVLNKKPTVIKITKRI
jgi:hypothetical protein